MSKQEFGILETRKDSFLIDDGSGAVAIARYDDENGAFFYDGQLEKVYLKDAKKLNFYTFKTDLYDRKDQVFFSEKRTFRAANKGEALANHYSHYPKPFDRTLIESRGFDGEELPTK